MITDDEMDALMGVMETAFEPLWREAWTRAQVASSLMMPTTHVIFADADGAPPASAEAVAGFLMSRAAPGEEELLLVGVAPDHRGRGVGQALLDRFAQAARARGAEKLFLEMRANNPAERLYRKCGYAPIGRRVGYYRTTEGERIDAITFGKDL